jgi:hypothetical protein
MTLFFAVGVGILLLLIGLSCAAIGMNPKVKPSSSSSWIFRILSKGFGHYIHTKLRIGLYFLVVLTAPFMTVYLYEWLAEPEMLEHIIMLSLPWLALVIFTAMTFPFRLEILQKDQSNISADELVDE